MNADPPLEPDAPGTGTGTDTDPDAIQWRRDGMTSPTVRLLWSFGVGTFFAMITIIAVWRPYELASEAGIIDWFAGRIPLFGPIIASTIAAVVVTIVVIALSNNTAQHVERLVRPLPVSPPSKSGVRRIMDAVLGTLVMGTIIISLLVIGRIVSQPELLGSGGESPFTGLAAATIPLALVALVLSSFLRSVGTFDREDETIYLYDPDQAIELSVLADASVRQIGGIAIVSLEYAQPDGQYVTGPRRLVVPPAVATEIVGAIRSSV